jgi:[acyl-carrier-protein] S-malonyltransferase
MGKELADTYPESRETFDAADAALSDSLSRTCFEGNEADLALTETTQPSILTVSTAASRALLSRGVRPEAVAGHSLGEYSAHVAAGTMDFSEAVRTVRERGRFMQQAVPVGTGAMAAILGLDVARVERLCAEAAGDEVVTPANLNGPGQVVVAGHRGAVTRVIDGALDAGAKRAIPLAVSAPFHCSLMAPAAERLGPVLADVSFGDPRIPVYANVDAAPVRERNRARRALIDQVTSPVLWQACIESMVADGIDTFVEVGPGRVLSGLIKRIRRDVDIYQVCDPAGVERVAVALGGGS